MCVVQVRALAAAGGGGNGEPPRITAHMGAAQGAAIAAATIEQRQARPSPLSGRPSEVPQARRRRLSPCDYDGSYGRCGLLHGRFLFVYITFVSNVMFDLQYGIQRIHMCRSTNNSDTWIAAAVSRAGM